MADLKITISDVRRAIDEADDILLKALAARFRATGRLKQLKRAEKKPVEDPERERQLKERWKERARLLGLKEELALLMLDFILTEAKRVQREK